jgi:hypothetical protein
VMRADTTGAWIACGNVSSRVATLSIAETVPSPVLIDRLRR